MQCIFPRIIYPRNKIQKMYNLPGKYPEGLTVPCGKCIACRISKRREWSLRMLHELVDHVDSVFITLTYDEDHVPENYSLKKTELQKFFKRLRKRLGKRKIRYFACGEYGDQTHRPHYHAIIFGLSLREEDKNAIRESWSCGMVHYGLAEPDSISYVAQYIDKKFTGDKAIQEYSNMGREPVFRLLSLGLGRKFADDNREQFIEHGVSMRGVPVTLPRYYVKRLNIDLTEVKEKALEKERDINKVYSDLNITNNEVYRQLKPIDVRDNNEAKKKAKLQYKKNCEARIALKKSKI